MSFIKNLICRQGDFELNIPLMEWPDKKVIALSGPSGSGKSTLALVLCGLKPVKKGFEWIFKDRNLALLSPPARNISLLFQSLELFPNMNAKKNILFPAEARKMSKEAMEKRFFLLTDRLQISSVLKCPVQVLSGGERQRVALARALMVKPDFLILDEPFSSLDDSLKKEAGFLVQEILEAEKLPTLLISHSKEEIKALAHQVFFIRNGRLVSD